MAPGLRTPASVDSREVDDGARSLKTGQTWRDRLVTLVRQVWFLPTVLTFAVGGFALWRPELWRDELRSWNAASRSFADLFTLLGKTDAATSLYYILLKLWMGLFGQSVTSMRMLSAVAMAGAAACVALIGQRLWNKKAGIFAGIVFAFIPAVTRFAQEVRPYALTMFMAGVCTLLLLRAIEKPSRGRFAAYAASLTGLALMQIVAIPILIAHAVGVLLWWQRNRVLAIRWVVAVGVGLLLASPIVLLSHSQYPHQVGDLPNATLAEMARLPQRLFVSGIVAGAVIGLGLLAWNSNIKSAAFAASWAALPVGAIWVISNAGESYWMARYMVFTLPGFALLAGAAAASMKNTRIALAVVLVVAGLGVADQRFLRQIGSHDQWTYPDPAYVHNPIMYSDAAKIIGDEMRPGDGIAYSGRDGFWMMDVGLQYHLREQGMPRDMFVDQTSVQNADFWPVECADFEACVGDTKRVWVVAISPEGTSGYFDVMEPGKKAALFRNFSVAKTWRPSGFAIALLERFPASN
jgi:mannosyltransferase